MCSPSLTVFHQPRVNNLSMCMSVYIPSILFHVSSLNFNISPIAFTLGKKMALLSAFFVTSLIYSVTPLLSAFNPDPVQDYCIPVGPGLNSPCKNSSAVSVSDFVFSGIRTARNLSGTGFTSTPVNVNNFPGLNTLGMSLVRADFGIGGINVPHYHPRATEVAYVLEGKIYSGFIDTQNRVFAKVVVKGEIMVFPKGLLHFQMNVGDTPAAILGSFDSQNPGLMKIPLAVFGSDVDEVLLEKAFGLSQKQVRKMKKFASQ